MVRCVDPSQYNAPHIPAYLAVLQSSLPLALALHIPSLHPCHSPSPSQNDFLASSLAQLFHSAAFTNLPTFLLSICLPFLAVLSLYFVYPSVSSYFPHLFCFPPPSRSPASSHLFNSLSSASYPHFPINTFSFASFRLPFNALTSATPPDHITYSPMFSFLLPMPSFPSVSWLLLPLTSSLILSVLPRLTYPQCSFSSSLHIHVIDTQSNLLHCTGGTPV